MVLGCCAVQKGRMALEHLAHTTYCIILHFALDGAKKQMGMSNDCQGSKDWPSFLPAVVPCELIEMSLAGLIGSFLVPGGFSQNGWCGKVTCHGQLLCCNVLQALDPEDYETRSDRDIEASYAANVFSGCSSLKNIAHKPWPRHVGTQQEGDVPDRKSVVTLAHSPCHLFIVRHFVVLRRSKLLLSWGRMVFQHPERWQSCNCSNGRNWDVWEFLCFVMLCDWLNRKLMTAVHYIAGGPLQSFSAFGRLHWVLHYTRRPFRKVKMR